MTRIFTLFSILAIIITGCKDQKTKTNQPIFESVSPNTSGISFANNLNVTDSTNFFKYGYFYMGGGVAVGDVNNDGLQDIYFTGNQVANKLYLNKGQLEFVDITAQAGVAADDRWITGASMSDVNADGLMDIYVSVAGIWTTTKNILYINQGLDENGIPTFLDEAEQRGVADEGKSIQTCFLDYDQDGDIDIYIANYEQMSFGSYVKDYKEKVDNPVLATSDHLYVNDGNGNFSDGTKAAGLLNFGLAVGVIASDFNNDNLTDLYVSNDFNTPDNFYFNNGDGTFTDLIKETTQHTAFYGMGVDAADINNDGLMDYVQVDMTPVDNFRSKANMASMNIPDFWKNIDAGFHYQYMYNVLQINQGIRPNGQPFFADLAKMSDIDKTDWSWASLFADFDNDSFQDLYVTNGTRRDINNKDFFNWLNRLDIKMKVKYEELTFQELTEMLPSKKVDNYMFRNLNGLKFEHHNKNWGIEYEGFSNGAAYADLDNDGDMEIVINNIDSTACIFNNLTSDHGLANHLRIELQGPENNPLGLGAKVQVSAGNQKLTREQTLVRGFQSSVDPVIHFGVGGVKQIEEVNITWPDGRNQKIENVKSNQLMTLKYSDSERSDQDQSQNRKIFTEITIEGLQQFVHEENEFDDFQHQILLPHMMSRLGPAVAIADVNGDGKTDIFIGGAKDTAPKVYTQNEDGSYSVSKFPASEVIYEDVSASFFDADNDGDQDLYVVSGGNDFEAGSNGYMDRLYLNQGGQLIRSEALPEFIVSGGTVIAEDYDLDGDLDLFVGGRQLPRKYPMPVSSYLLENVSQNGQLKFEISDQPALKDIGMITTAKWIDMDGDQSKELILAGEWTPIFILEWSDGTLEDVTNTYGLGNTTGWWNVVEAADFDNDGDMDLVAGNLGLNYKYKATSIETFDIYANDYDENGHLDIVLGYYQGDKQFPVRGLSCSSEQIPVIKKKFKNKYNDFAQATLIDIYGSRDLKEGIHYRAQVFSSLYIENLGNKNLKTSDLPFEVQSSSFNSMIITDFNEDGHLDIIAGGNQFNAEVETPRNDACYGWLLKGDGQGNFDYLDYSQSGLYVPYDIRSLRLIGNETILFVSNRGPLKTYSWNR